MERFAVALLAACGATQPTPATDGVRSAPIVDSHVHLAYWPVADELAKHGVAAVIDLAAPAIVTSDALQVISSGPMLTRPNGYPLDSWGSDGYGIGCADAACVDKAIADLAARGARVVKIALDDNGLDEALVPHAIDFAHAKGMKVAVHALSNHSALVAARANADVLAHTPVEPLAAETIAAWKSRAVITTLAAFGGSESAIENLRALRSAGATILYGTDLGNLRDAGPSGAELSLLKRAGLDDAAIVDAMTSTPTKFWVITFSDDTYLVVDRDPRIDMRTLLSPRAVYLRGKRM